MHKQVGALTRRSVSAEQTVNFQEQLNTQNIVPDIVHVSLLKSAIYCWLFFKVFNLK